MATIGIITPKQQDFERLKRSGQFGENIELILVQKIDHIRGRTFDGYVNYLDFYNVQDFDTIEQQLKLRII